MLEWIIIADITMLGDSNWDSFVNKKITLVIFEKSDCEQCEKLSNEIINDAGDYNFDICKLRLDTPGSSQIKLSNPWISNIDILPFCVVFKEGQMTDSWAGSDFARIILRVNSD